MGSIEYSRLRGGIAAGMSVHSGKIASPSAFMFRPPLLPRDRELVGGRPVRCGEAVRSYLAGLDPSDWAPTQSYAWKLWVDRAASEAGRDLSDLRAEPPHPR